MTNAVPSTALLVSTVALVGVLHTMVPDHWAPIAVLARQNRWSTAKTARTAAIAGVGHTLSTLLIAVIVWTLGVVSAQRFGHAASVLSSVALVGFGGWIAYGAWRELQAEAHHDHDHAHGHAHEHSPGAPVGNRTALLLILGSSPMIEGIPAFFAAGPLGPGVLALMSLVFAVSTIGAYVALCVAAARGMQALRLGRFERYGEVVSGLLVAAIGAIFAFV